MSFKVGDKVSFINEKRDGVIKKIINNQMVSVEIEDGFDIPVVISEIVKMQFQESDIDGGVVEKKEESIFQNQLEEDKSLSKKLYIHDKSIGNGLYIAYTIDENANISTANINIYLINHTENMILFKYGVREGNYYVDKDYDITEAESSYNLASINISEINDWCEFEFQVLFFNPNAKNTPQPLVHKVSMNPIRLYKENSFRYLKLIHSKAVVMALGSDKEKFDWEAKEKNNIEPLHESQIIESIDSVNKQEPFPDKYLVEPKIAEIDIHIWELTDNYRNMTNTQMVTMQVNYFKKYLQDAIDNRLKKIIFIHGVGNGTLKTEIRKTLDELFPYLSYHDAPIAKYGVGATEIEIPHNIKI